MQISRGVDKSEPFNFVVFVDIWTLLVLNSHLLIDEGWNEIDFVDLVDIVCPKGDETRLWFKIHRPLGKLDSFSTDNLGFEILYRDLF